jgi:general secretion pathway protein D
VGIVLAISAGSARAQDVAESSGSPAEAQNLAEAGNATEEGLRLNFRGVPLDTVLDYMSEAAGFVIVRNTEVSGRVDVWSHQPLSKDEAVNLLNTILNEKGYAAVRNGRTLTIVDRDEAKKRDIPVRTGSDPDKIEKTDEMVTQIIPVRYANVVQLIENIQPLLPSYAIATANESSNAIVLTDTQTNVRRMAEIIQALDTSISNISAIRVFTLKYADATEIAQLVNELFRTEESRSGARGDRSRQVQEFISRMRGGRGGDGGSFQDEGESAARQAAVRVVAVADERTNSLVVSAPDELMPTIEDLITQIDDVSEDITEVRVFALRYADAEQMTEIINNMFEEDGQSSERQSQQRVFRGPPFMRDFMRGQQRQQQQQDQSRRQAEESTVVAVADTRTNSVVVTAASQTMDQIGRMVKELDSDPAKDRKVFIYSLENADAETVAEILTNMFEQRDSRTGSSRTGTGRTSSTRQPVFGQGTQNPTSGTSESRFGGR